MNIIFVTQGSFADFYMDLIPMLQENIQVGTIGFYLTHRSNFPLHAKKSKLLGRPIKFLKEWDRFPPDPEEYDSKLIDQLETRFGNPSLWDALVMDRRVYNGILTKYKQDYKARYSHREMLVLLQKSFQSTLDFIEDIRPDIIIGGFTPVTLGEYIFYLCAKNMNIKYINLNPTKIKNHVIFSNEIYREYPIIKPDYDSFLKSKPCTRWMDEAKEYLETWDKKYEGIVISSPVFPYARWSMSILAWPYIFIRYFLRKEYKDNQRKGYQWGFFLKNIYNPVKDKIISFLIPYSSVEELEAFTYAYYPLHIEPEIALSLFGKEHLNQIELIRNIAKSLPVSWKLLVKDHPAGVGRRNIQYYRKLLEIPNVLLANHYSEPKHIMDHAQLVFTISGFSGFEATCLKKPVITFGRTFYNRLPDTMVRNVKCLADLPEAVKNIMAVYHYEKEPIVSLIAAVIKNSCPLNLYQKILKKGNRITIAEGHDDSMKQFCNYLQSCL